MDLVGVVKGGKVELPESVHLPEGTRVRVLVEGQAGALEAPFETDPLSEESVLADIAWATGRRFPS